MGYIVTYNPLILTFDPHFQRDIQSPNISGTVPKMEVHTTYVREFPHPQNSLKLRFRKPSILGTWNFWTFGDPSRL